ncbi:hypothetical protein GJ744_000544 [Endocarpon pusillum]|uniref:Uncharacterized protein n=1 Tax=Endocarpon pusillum TaxID=364733 RepID=A0A8H7AAP8_9EURO|nr:hypothetical protein GJ744_000544 [Endocarpon pusillum]
MSSRTRNTKPEDTITTKMPTTASTSKEAVRDMLLEKYPPLFPESGSALEITRLTRQEWAPFRWDQDYLERADPFAEE